MRGVAVLERVRERLLDDAIRGEVDAGGQRAGIPGDREGDVQPGRPHALDELRQAREPRRRRQSGRLAGRRLDDAEQSSQLGQRLAARRLDRAQRLARTLGMGREDVGARSRLQNHHAHVVGDHVVQLARDARPLLGDGHPRPLLLLFLDRRFARLHTREIGVAPPDVVSDRPRRDEEAEHRHREEWILGRMRRCRDRDGRHRHAGRRQGHAALVTTRDRVQRDQRPGELKPAETADRRPRQRPA